MGPAVLYFSLILARVGTAVAVMPLFGGRNTPHLIKAGLTLALAVFWFGALPAPPDAALWERLAQGPMLGLSLVLGREMVLGAVLGFAFNLFLVPARVAGEYISQEIGLPLASVLGPAADSQAGPITLILEALSGLVFLGLDLHHLFLGTLHATFARYPVAGGGVPFPLAGAVGGVAYAQEMGLLLAAPVAALLFLVTVALALLTRAAPQMNIYSVGFPVQAGAALAALLLLLPELLTLVGTIFARLSGLLAGML